MLFVEINGYKLQQYTFYEALLQSGVAESDDEMTQTEALNQWLKDRRWTMIKDGDPESYAQQLIIAMDMGMDTLILKEK
jgi:hypothetical protein